MLDDVAVYLLISPVAVVVVLVLGAVAWAMRRVSLLAARRTPRANPPRLPD